MEIRGRSCPRGLSLVPQRGPNQTANCTAMLVSVWPGGLRQLKRLKTAAYSSKPLRSQGTGTSP